MAELHVAAMTTITELPFSASDSSRRRAHLLLCFACSRLPLLVVLCVTSSCLPVK